MAAMAIFYIIVIMSVMAHLSYPTHNVIVIGAGASGLSAARELINDGRFLVTVLEARPDRYGGRIWTNVESFTDTSGLGVDLGASFIHLPSADNRLMQLMKEFNLPTFDSEPCDKTVIVREATGVPYNESHVLSTFEHVEKAFDAAMDYSRSQNKELTLHDALIESKQAASINDSLSQVVVAYEEFWFGDHLDKVSAQLYEAGVENVTWVPDKIPTMGFRPLLEKLIQANSSDAPINIQFGKEVTSVDVLDNWKARVTCKDGAVYESDAVIVTLPLGVLKANDVKFTPDLSRRKRQAIDRLGVGNANKIVLQFDRIFWPRNMHHVAIAVENITERGELALLDNFRPHSDLPIMLTYAVGHFAKQSEQMSDDQLQELALKRLRTVFGSAMDNVKVINMVRTRWMADAFSKGSYSYPTIGTQLGDWDTVGEPGPPLFFAGEHTQTKFFGLVQTALDTGRRSAHETIFYLDNKIVNSAGPMSLSLGLLVLVVMYLAWQSIVF